jgi:DNA-binding LacI/PurR family transcriptional regulator
MREIRFPPRITAADVARRAGVSQSAVSRVFTPGGSASPATIEKVRRAAAALRYRPNVMARTLAGGRTRMIGLVAAYFENYFYPDALEKLSRALQKQGYHVLVFMAAQTAAEVETVVQEILDYQVDGIVCASVALSSELASRCEAAGVPVVLFNRAQDDDRLAAVTSDNSGGGGKVAELFLASGHERIAYIAGWEGASTQRDREAGFRSALAASGRSLFARGIGDFRFEEAKEAARRMFARPERPDAVFVANDHMAFAVMDVLRDELRLRVPEDVAVVGYDDVPPASWAAYALTTVRQRSQLMADETVRLLIDRLEDPAVAPRRVAIDGPLIIRKTTRRPDCWRG